MGPRTNPYRDRSWHRTPLQAIAAKARDELPRFGHYLGEAIQYHPDGGVVCPLCGAEWALSVHGMSVSSPCLNCLFPYPSGLPALPPAKSVRSGRPCFNCLRGLLP